MYFLFRIVRMITYITLALLDNGQKDDHCLSINMHGYPIHCKKKGKLCRLDASSATVV